MTTEIQQRKKWKVNDTKTKTFYKDKSFELKAAFTWDTNKNITKIIFNGKSLGKNMYKICKIENCTSQGYITIHMITSGDKQKTNYDYNSKHKLDVNDELVFKFKIYERSNCPENTVCEMGNGTPETKDGTIVIGI